MFKKINCAILAISISYSATVAFSQQIDPSMVYQMNYNWDENLLLAKFFVNYEPIAKIANEDEVLNFAELQSYPAQNNPNSLLGFVDQAAGTAWPGLSSYRIKGRFVQNYEQIVKEFIQRLIVNGRSKANSIYRITDLGNGLMEIKLPSGAKKFKVSQTITQFKEVREFISCYFENGEAKETRIKNGCGAAVMDKMHVNAVKVKLDYLSRKIAELGYCFGIDPIAFTSMLYRETSFNGKVKLNENDLDKGKLPQGGIGFTQMVPIGILEVDKQLFPERFRAGNKALRDSVSNISDEQSEANITNVLCYDSNFQPHQISMSPQDAGSLVASKPEGTVWAKNVKQWLVGFGDDSLDENTLFNRQFIYGAVLKKGILTHSLKAQKTSELSMYSHYYEAAKRYNGHPEHKFSYAKDIAEDYPALMGLKMPKDELYDCHLLYPQRDRFIIDPEALEKSHPRCFGQINSQAI